MVDASEFPIMSVEHGFNSFRPGILWKLEILRVINGTPCTSAVAAITASGSFMPKV
jgi:hypothetical protein